MPGLISGLVNAGTAGLLGAMQGDDARKRAVLAEAARRAQAQRDKEEMDLKRIAALGTAASQGFDLSGATSTAPAPTVSRRSATGAAPVTPEGGREAVSVPVAGQVEPGNIDLTRRPRVKNPDGSVSTVRSMSANIDGREVLLPTVSDDGRLLSNDEAIAEYQRSGKHLGVFADPASATAYAQRLHGAQADMLDGRGDGNVAAVAPSGETPPATSDGTPIGEVAGVRIAVPPGGLQGKATREAQQKARQGVQDRRARLDAHNATLPPGDARRLAPSLVELLAGNESLYSKWAERAAGLGAPDPTAVHRANRDYDVRHPLKDPNAAPPAAKATEFSNKAALVYPRAMEAFQTLDKFYTSGIPAHQGLGRIPVVGNMMLSPEEQSAASAAETVSSAILRLESGAAISEHEVKEYAKQFLPQIGDSEQVRAEKRSRLLTQLERMRQAASPTMSHDTPAPTVTTRSSTPPPPRTISRPGTRPTASQASRPDVKAIRDKYGLEP